jgi:hypothetical protein
MKRLLSLAAAFSAALVLLFTPQMAYAATTSSSGLSITPRKNYTIEPGKSVTDKLTINNLNGSVPLYITLRTIDFTFTDETGTPKLMISQDIQPTTWSLKPFIKLPTDTLEIPAGGSKTVEYKVEVPANQGGGSYYSAIQYVSGSSDGGNVNLSASGATLAFLSVPGPVNEDMKLEKFGAFQRDTPTATTGKYLKIAVGDSPSVIAYTLKNNGNVFESPAGSITLKGMFGGTVATIEKANPNSNIALIGQSRRFEACISAEVKKVDLNGKEGESVSCKSTRLWPGRYTASLDVFYGQNGNTTHDIAATTTFWYLPMWFLMALGVLILFIIYLIWRIKRKLSGKSDVRSNLGVGSSKRKRSLGKLLKRK